MAKAHRIICLDTETTGLGKDDEIIQLSIADAISGECLLNQYFRPSDSLMKRCWDAAARVTGITPESVRDCLSLSDCDIHDFIQSIIDDANIIVGYHLNFDVDMLERASFVFDDCSFQDPMHSFATFWWTSNPELKHVTKKGKEISPWLSWKKNIRGRKGQWISKNLTFVAKYFDIDDFGAHDSMNDVHATIGVWKGMNRIQQRINSENVNQCIEMPITYVETFSRDELSLLDS